MIGSPGGPRTKLRRRRPPTSPRKGRRPGIAAAESVGAQMRAEAIQDLRILLDGSGLVLCREDNVGVTGAAVGGLTGVGAAYAVGYFGGRSGRRCVTTVAGAYTGGFVGYHVGGAVGAFGGETGREIGSTGGAAIGFFGGANAAGGFFEGGGGGGTGGGGGGERSPVPARTPRQGTSRTIS